MMDYEFDWITNKSVISIIGVKVSALMKKMQMYSFCWVNGPVCRINLQKCSFLY